MIPSRSFAFVAALFLRTGLSAQPHWDTQLHGLGAEHVSDVKVASDGSIYATGEFSNVVSLGSQTFAAVGGTDVFVAKLDASGSVLWLRTAGGISADRGIRLAVTGSSVVVVGQWMGTADLFGTTVVSTGTALDAFTARLNTSDGSTQWVRTGGGAVGATRPNGVTLAANGNTTVAGEFRGTATFGTSSITSMPDTFTLDPGIDVFIASYDATGALLWLKQGAAPFTDRAIDVVSDAASDLYVGGQYSDTITFDQTYPNTLFNAMFVLKLDPAGSELWFRRGGGALQNTLRDMQWSGAGDLLLAGDLRGTTTWFDGSPNTISAGAAYAYFLLRVNAAGDFISASSTGSENQVTVRGIDQRADTVAVLGEFKCQFTALSDLYGGDGLFMATGTQDLFVTKHRFSDLALLEGQQFGGQKGKKAGQIASLANGALVFCGSFAQLLVFPSGIPAWADFSAGAWNCTFVNFNEPGLSWCGDPLHGHFEGDASDGQRDGFISRGYVNGRAPYDFWHRLDTADCDRGVIEPCIETFEGIYRQCPDSLFSCVAMPLRVMGRDWSQLISPFSWLENDGIFPYCDSAGYTGPDVNFLWSDGTTDRSTFANTTGWYWCTLSTTNGCWSWTDSVHVTVGPVPTTPLISDDLGFNVDAAATIPIFPCGSPAWVWVSNPEPGVQYIWYVNGVASPGDSVLADTTGLYTVNGVGPNGCVSYNFVPVFFGGSGTPLPNITGVQVEFTPDSATICPTDCGAFSNGGLATWYVNGLPTVLTDGYMMTTVDCGPPPVGNFNTSPQAPFAFGVVNPQNGWNTFTVALTINNGTSSGCTSETAAFNVTDSIYLEIVPAQPIQVTGPAFICPGDTALVLADCGSCDSVNWSGDGIVWTSATGDSMLTVLGGTFDAFSAITGSDSMVCGTIGTIDILPPDDIEIMLSAEQMCPGDSVLLSTTTSGSNLEWTGPLGPLSATTPSVYVHDFGSYSLSLIDTNGCLLTSAPVELEALGPPLVDVQPELFLCPGETGQIEVFVDGPATIAWGAPLSGSDPVQTISAPGVYTVTVTSCGVPYLFTVPVYGSTPEIELATPGPFDLCPGDSVVLAAYPGPGDYFWLPSEVPGTTLIVGEEGAFQAVLVDEYGCVDTSTMVNVSLTEFTVPLAVLDVVACDGSDVALPAIGSGIINWYTDPALTQLVFTGNPYGIGSGAQSQTYYVTQTEGPCTSAPDEMQLIVLPGVTDLLLNAPAALCLGQTAELSVGGTPTPNVTWITPTGPMTGNPLVIDPVTAADAGDYAATAFLGPCVQGILSVTLATVSSAAADLGPDSVVCPAQPITLQLSAGLGDVQWSDGTTGSTIVVTLPGTYWFLAQDGNGCTVTDTIHYEASECDPVMPNVLTPNGDGVNDVVELWSPSADPLVMTIFNRWGRTVFEASGRKIEWNGRTDGDRLSEGVYYYEVHGTRLNGSTMVLTGYIHVLYSH